MQESKRTITGSEPITTAEFKSFAGTAYTDDDLTLIPSVIASARGVAEAFCNRSFVAQTIEYTEVLTSDELDYIHSVKLPFPNHLEVTEVKVNGTVTVNYSKTGNTRFILWFDGLTADVNGNCEIYVKFKAIGDCPDMVKLGILNIAKDMYENKSTTPLSNNGFHYLQLYKTY